MSIVEGHETEVRRARPVLRVVTLGPGEEDWAVLDEDGEVAYLGPALFAARYAARLSA